MILGIYLISLVLYWVLLGFTFKLTEDGISDYEDDYRVFFIMWVIPILNILVALILLYHELDLNYNTGESFKNFFKSLFKLIFKPFSK